jgi:hypothetical protein
LVLPGKPLHFISTSDRLLLPGCCIRLLVYQAPALWQLLLVMRLVEPYALWRHFMPVLLPDVAEAQKRHSAG